MAVFRIERTRDYTVMSNHHLRNGKLSLKAKGLLSQMLSLPEDWDFTCFASMFVRQVRQCFSAVWADGFPRCRHRFPVM